MTNVVTTAGAYTFQLWQSRTLRLRGFGSVLDAQSDGLDHETWDAVVERLLA